MLKAADDCWITIQDDLCGALASYPGQGLARYAFFFSYFNNSRSLENLQSKRYLSSDKLMRAGKFGSSILDVINLPSVFCNDGQIV